MLQAAELVREIQEKRENGFLSDSLLRYAVRAIRRSDARFDWVGVYLLTPDGSELWLHNYVGKPTDHARIPVDRAFVDSPLRKRPTRMSPTFRRPRTTCPVRRLSSRNSWS
jgi:putative methionine-R-sulfoxide reductase with GAF domain